MSEWQTDSDGYNPEFDCPPRTPLSWKRIRKKISKTARKPSTLVGFIFGIIFGIIARSILDLLF
jgi:hypothetical protein